MHKISGLFGLFVSLLMVPGAFAGQCRQANLQSQDGSRIWIDYPSNNATDGNSAWLNTTVHVHLTGEKCSAVQVVAQLVSSQFGYTSSKAQTLNRVQGSPCEVAAPHTIGLANHGGTLGQAIAVQLIYADGNSEWLVDPVSQAHNFNYRFLTDGYAPVPFSCP